MYPLSRFVVTSRPPAVDELAWPAWQVWLREAGFAESWLADMHWPQIEVFVRRWHDALDKVTTHADDRRTVGQNRRARSSCCSVSRRCAGWPPPRCLCAMICALYQRQGDHIAPQRLELYRNCVDMLLWERDRRHPRRKVPALADYHQFKKDQLLSLLSHLAYWMMDEGASAVSRERVAAQFEMYLPNLGLDPALSERAYEYFDERASVWDQPAAGMVEFRHRTFQEYLAAGWAMQQDKVGALAERAANTQWRETIVLAAGSGTPAAKLGLVAGDLAASRAAQRPRRTYGATCCCWRWTAWRRAASCRRRNNGKKWWTGRNRSFHPHSREEAEMVANGGVRAIDLLAYDPDYPEEIAAYCIQALAAIGGDKAMDAIAAYAGDERWRVRQAIGDAWSQFEAQRYAEQVLAGRIALVLSAAPPTGDQLRLLPNLTQLDLSGTSVSDLSALAGLTQLTQLVPEWYVRQRSERVGRADPTHAAFPEWYVRQRSERVGRADPTHAALPEWYVRQRSERVGRADPTHAAFDLSGYVRQRSERVGRADPTHAALPLPEWYVRQRSERVGRADPTHAAFPDEVRWSAI